MSPSKPRSRRYLFLCVLAATLLLASGVIAGSADSHASLTVDDSTPIPAETVEFESETYQIDATTVRDPGNAFTAEVTLPNETYTDVAFLLYNSDQQIEASERINRPGTTETATFETDSYAPGTYMLNVELEGATEQMQPVVIAGYDVAVDHPTEPSRDETVDVTAEVTPTELSSAPAGVEVVVWNESHSQRFEMSQSDDETYTTSIALDQFEAGEYTVNVAALGDETFRGQQEVLALESSSLTIQETTTSDDTNDSDASSDESGSDESTSDDTQDDDTSTGDDDESSSDDASTETNNTSADEETSLEVDNSSSDDSASSETNTTTDDDTGESATNGSETTDANESNDDVIAPNEESASENTEDQVSLFAVQGVFLLILVVVSIRRLGR